MCMHHSAADRQCTENNALQISGLTTNTTCGFIRGGIETCQNGVWKRLCDNEWTIEDAIVACRQLSYSTIGEEKLGVTIVS